MRLCLKLSTLLVALFFTRFAIGEKIILGTGRGQLQTRGGFREISTTTGIRQTLGVPVTARMRGTVGFLALTAQS